MIITTHYIEEARQAHYVGLMRQGRLLAENSPEQLLAQYNMETLEEVFLKLCMTDSSTKEGRAELMQNGLFADMSGSNAQTVAKVTSGFDNPALDLDLENVANNNISKMQDNNSGTSAAIENQSKLSNAFANYTQNTFQAVEKVQPNRRYEKKHKETFGEYWNTTMALFWKNITRLRRNIP